MDALRNQAKSSRAWMSVTLFLMGLIVFLVLALAAQSVNTPVRLIPQQYDAATGPIEIASKLSGSEDYLTQVAIADVQNYTTWTPKTAPSQMARFVNRMTPKLYASQGAALMERAANLGGSEQSQSFFIDRTSVGGTNVIVEGTLTIWQGKEQVSNIRMVYTVGYVKQGGLPKITTFNGKTERQARR